MVVAVLYQVEFKRSSTTCLLLCRTAGSSGTCRSSKSYSRTHVLHVCVCVCVHRATCSTVDKVEKVEKVLLKQYGNTGGTRYTCTCVYTTFVYFGNIGKHV